MNTIQKNISRRNFVKLSGMTGAALTLGFSIPANGKEVEILTGADANGKGIELNAFITINDSGKVTITDHRSEMGQGSYQTVPQIIAEELEVNLDQVSIVFGEGNGAKYGSQLTGGSSTVRGAYKHLCSVGASAREMLKEAAAMKWGVNKSECYAENGNIIHKPSGKKFHYGELVADAAKLTPPKNVVLKRRDEYKILRKPLPRQDAAIKSNGAAIFGMDKRIPGMLYAVVERNPRFIGKVKSFDDTAAKQVKGVKHVFTVKRNVFASMCEGVAVVADNLWSAMQGRKALKVDWDDSGFDYYSTEQLYAKMNEGLKSSTSLSFKTKGNSAGVIEKSMNKVEAVYETPYESHSCMEPLNCVAHFHDDILEVWGPVQAPDWTQNSLSQQLGMPAEKIKVNMTFLGGGFGRKAFMDYPHEAALISKEIKAPVMVVWSREDDMTLGPFRPGMVYACRAALNERGGIDAFETKMAGQNMNHQWPGASKDTYNDSVTEGFLETYMEGLGNYSFADSPLDAPIPVMWWRSVYSSTNGFAFESFMDELALKAGKDPLDFRKQHFAGNSADRCREMVNKLEEVSGWKSRAKNSGFGVAITECFSTIVGEVVKVSKTPEGKVEIDKVWAVMDCGWYVNPDIIRQQIEGSIIMAIGAAVTHATDFADGKAVQKNFDSYKMPRYGDTPEIEVHIMENDEKPGGVGEPSLPPFAPALTNAIFDLTGKRIRKLPFKLGEV
jgi:isoquinoline 1-oxidoreductase beta subunit